MQLAAKDAVSIHAPARGATAQSDNDGPLFPFQSTRPRGARPTYLVVSGLRVCFNPRARAGRDGVWPRLPPRAKVSIHAPARGATLQPRRCALGSGFNPRARAGRDHSSGDV